MKVTAKVRAATLAAVVLNAAEIRAAEQALDNGEGCSLEDILDDAKARHPARRSAVSKRPQRRRQPAGNRKSAAHSR